MSEENEQVTFIGPESNNEHEAVKAAAYLGSKVVTPMLKAIIAMVVKIFPTLDGAVLVLHTREGAVAMVEYTCNSPAIASEALNKAQLLVETQKVKS